MAARMPLNSTAVEAALLPWLGVEPEEATDGTAAVREEARLIFQILMHVEALASSAEVRRTFSRTPQEAYLTEALLAGGAAGKLDWPKLLNALRAAAAAGSAWAPLWLGDVEFLSKAGGGGQERGDVAGGLDARRRAWYVQAARRGHPDATHRLAAHGEVPPPLAPPLGLQDEDLPTVQSAVGLASAFAQGGGASVSSEPSAGLASAFANGGGLPSADGPPFVVLAGHGTPEGGGMIDSDAEESKTTEEGFYEDDEVCRRLLEVSCAIDAVGDDAEEDAGLRAVVLGNPRSRL